MSLKKTVAIVAAAGALAAISLPAMAFDNEFHGSYTFNTILSNYQDGASGNLSPIGRSDKKMNNYFEQRARLQYTAKASDDLKLVTHFEINNRFGNINTVLNSQNGQTDISGSDLDTDGLTFLTKHVYLDFNLGSNFNVKTGLMPYKDTIKGFFIDADIPAVMTTTTLGSYKLGLGYSRLNDEFGKGTFAAGTTTFTSNGLTRLGDLSTDLVMLDNTFAFSKDTKAGLSYYLLANYSTKDRANLLNTIGLSGETKLGGLGLSGFAAMQAGHQKGSNAAGSAVAGRNAYYHGWAANVTAKLAVGPGTAKTAFLFASGNNNTDTEQNRGWVPSGVSSYNDGGMMLIARSTANSPTSTDRYIRRNITNLALVTLGYDANLSSKVYLNGNVGLAWTPASGETANKGDFMGTEINLETGYKVSDNLKLRAQGGYMLLGSLYKNTATNDPTKDPENPYTMRLFATFAF